eukprot:TRINITY_DN777_c0_g1_i10.p1 TRINITY_DN777_c0_g1~~TRINITY_DN777_c0_g1_i10.p1  ORF type:complete len:577 (+),score=201.19 TRINITY_DN777_c0_g1_i10:317-2047(+)
MDTKGWDVVVINQVNNAPFTAPSQYGYALGFLEAYVTYADIYNNYYNTVQQTLPVAGTPGASDVIAWIQSHIDFMRLLASNPVDDYTNMLARMLSQLDGMTAGYKSGCNAQGGANCEALPFAQIFYINFQAEMGDVMTAYNYTANATFGDDLPRRNMTHCSALIKPVADDIFFSHVTWSGYNTMLRQYKTYNYGGTQYVTMSSYAGVIMSIDDWYMTGSRLAVMETTNGVYNNSLFVDNLKPKPEVVSYFIRVMIANFLATSSPNWVDTFVKFNSGTYNNQWMVLDMKVVTPGKAFPKNSFWIVETLPIMYAAGDVSEVVNTQGYWASYNLPYFTEIYQLSGTQAMLEQFGDFYSYTKYARPMIFARNHTDIKNLDDFKAMMRYNNFKEDPLSKIQNCKGAGTDNTCNPPYSSFLTIASRGDLNTPGDASNYGPNFAHLNQRQHAATDAKIATYKNMMSAADTMTGVVINGPTTSGGRWEPFQWSTSPWKDDSTKVRRVGLPDLYNFSYEDFATVAPPKPVDPGTVDSVVKSIGYSIAGVGGACVVLTMIVLGAFFIKDRNTPKPDAVDGAAYAQI